MIGNASTESMKRLVQIAAAFVIAGGTAWVAVEFGPRPSGPLPGNPESPATVRPEPDPAAGLAQIDILFGFLGSVRTAMGEGCDKSAPSLYFQQMEARYRSEGYQATAVAATPATHEGGSVPDPKFYWRSRTANVEMIGRNTKGKASGAPELEIVAGTASPLCGTRWKEFHYPAPSFRPKGSASNFPVGTREPDTDGIPRPAGSRRLFAVTGAYGGEVRAYVSDQPPAELRAWYRTEMLKSWSLQVQPPDPGIHAFQGAMYFSRAGRYCLIWVAEKSTQGKTMAVLSTGSN